MEIKKIESANYKLKCLVWVNFPMIYTQVFCNKCMYFELELFQTRSGPEMAKEFVYHFVTNFPGCFAGLLYLNWLFGDRQPIHSASVRRLLQRHSASQMEQWSNFREVHSWELWTLLLLPFTISPQCWCHLPLSPIRLLPRLGHCSQDHVEPIWRGSWELWHLLHG